MSRRTSWGFSPGHARAGESPIGGCWSWLGGQGVHQLFLVMYNRQINVYVFFCRPDYEHGIMKIQYHLWVGLECFFGAAFTVPGYGCASETWQQNPRRGFLFGSIGTKLRRRLGPSATLMTRSTPVKKGTSAPVGRFSSWSRFATSAAEVNKIESICAFFVTCILVRPAKCHTALVKYGASYA